MEPFGKVLVVAHEGKRNRNWPVEIIICAAGGTGARQFKCARQQARIEEISLGMVDDHMGAAVAGKDQPLLCLVRVGDCFHDTRLIPS